MKRYILPSLLLVAAFAVQAQDADTDTTNMKNNQQTVTQPSNGDLSGNYVCEGTSPDNEAYSNTQLTITKSDQTYQMSWQNEKYGKFSGTAIPNSADNSIAAAFNNIDKTADTMKSGIVVYKSNADGSLQGVWTFNTKDKLGSETCKKS